MNENRSPSKEIENDNPWYTGKQIDNLKIPAYEYTSLNRWKYISDTISKYQSGQEGKIITVLDAGCGDGVNLLQLSKEKNCDLYGVDYNEVRVERAQEKFQDATIAQDDLTVKNEAFLKKFDVILCSQVIEHIPDYKATILNLKEYLKPNGILILGTPNEGCLLAKMRNHFFERSILDNTDHIHFFRISPFKKLINEMGFNINYTFKENFFYPKSKLFVYMGATELRRKISRLLMNVFPSQVAGFYLTLTVRS